MNPNFHLRHYRAYKQVGDRKNAASALGHYLRTRRNPTPNPARGMFAEWMQKNAR